MKVSSGRSWEAKKGMGWKGRGQALEAMVVKNGVLFPDITISQMQIDVVF